jgi:DNA-binding transcriptional LysR family regulator
MLHWDDLRLVLAVARAGSFAGAADMLGVSAPTVFRHARAVEARLGTQVFRRDTTGVSLTPAGREAAALAARMEEDVGALEARIGNADGDAVGTIRLATVDTLLAGPLMPLLARFRAAHPRIVLDVQSGIGMANLRQREVDAALRAGGSPPDTLVGRRLCRIAVAVYGARTLPPIDAGDPGALRRQPWLLPDEHLGHLASAAWARRHGYDAGAVLRANSLHTLALAAAAGLGLAALPCYLADADPRLVRIGAPIAELAGELWFLTHAELRHTARLRSLADFFNAEIRTLRPLFAGEQAARA